jgi:fatty acid desaturase
MSELDVMPAHEIKAARALLADLHKPDARLFYADLVSSSVVGYGALAISVTAQNVFVVAASFLIASFALWRAVQFIHEIVHLPPRAVPYLGALWNLLVGIPFFVPLFLFGAHHEHHRAARYATGDDPEYVPLARGTKIQLALVLGESLLAPLFLWLRFGPLALAGLFGKRVRRFVLERASTLGLNHGYRRRDLAEDRGPRFWRLQEVSTASWAILVPVLVALGVLPPRVVITAALAASFVAFVDQVKTVVVHRFLAAGNTKVAHGAQILDAINIEGGVISELWAPLGNRFHALHHLAPSLPYHNAARAHRRLLEELPADAAYRRTCEPTLLAAFASLLASQKHFARRGDA